MTELKITVDREQSKILIEKLLLEKLQNNSIKICLEILTEKKSLIKEKTKLLKNQALIDFNVTEQFINNHYLIASEDYQIFYKELKIVFGIITKITDKIVEQYNTFTSVSFSFNYKDLLLIFPFNFTSNLYDIALEKAYKFIILVLSENDKKLKKNIRQVFDEGDDQRIFHYKNDNWTVVDPLAIRAADINDRYRENKDIRVKKPHIAINKENIWKHFTFEQNWVLTFDNLETFMIQPNDVSIYSNIAYKNLEKAEKFYNENIIPRHKQYYGSFPSEREQSKYFDYFELIIQSVIFSYTSLEAFANICIPINYEHIVEKDGIKTIYSKEAIERKFALRDKFKVILKDVLQTPDVSKDKWWNNFIRLEDLRNEIIHSKPSKSEDRYSKLLEKEIFILIKNHRTIIEYYGKFIAFNNRYLMNEFPYNFGLDEVEPGLMSGKNYNKTFKSINNIPE